MVFKDNVCKVIEKNVSEWDDNKLQNIQEQGVLSVGEETGIVKSQTKLWVVLSLSTLFFKDFFSYL